MCSALAASVWGCAKWPSSMQQKQQMAPYEQLVSYREQLATDLARVEQQVRLRTPWHHVLLHLCCVSQRTQRGSRAGWLPWVALAAIFCVVSDTAGSRLLCCVRISPSCMPMFLSNLQISDLEHSYFAAEHSQAGNVLKVRWQTAERAEAANASSNTKQ